MKRDLSRNCIVNRINGSEIIKGFISSSIWGGLSKVIAVLVTMYCSNKLTQNGFGEFSFIRNTLNMIIVICATNFNTLAVKFAAESITSKDSLRRLAILLLFTISVGLIVSVVSIVIPYDKLQSFTGGSSVAYFIRVAGLFMPIFIIQPMISAIFRGYKEFNLVGIYETVNIVVYFVMIVVGISLWGYKGAICAILLYYIFFSLSGITLLFVYNKRTRYISRVDNIRSQSQSIFKMILPIFVMSFVEAPLVWIAQAEIGRNVSYAIVGSLSVISTIGYLVQIVPTYFFQSFLPHITVMNSEGQYGNYFKKFFQVSKAIAIISFLLIPLLLVFGKFLLGIFNKSYVESYDSYVISIFVLPLIIYSVLLKLNMLVREHQIDMLIMTIISSVCFLLFFFIFERCGFDLLNSFFYAQFIQYLVQLVYSSYIFNGDYKKQIILNKSL